MPTWMRSSVKRLDYPVYSFIQKVIIIPVINFRVANGKVTVAPPDLSVHRDSPLRDFEEDFVDLSLPPEYRELGLPFVWYDDFSERVEKKKKKLVE